MDYYKEAKKIKYCFYLLPMVDLKNDKSKAGLEKLEIFIDTLRTFPFFGKIDDTGAETVARFTFLVILGVRLEDIDTLANILVTANLAKLTKGMVNNQMILPVVLSSDLLLNLPVNTIADTNDTIRVFIRFEDVVHGINVGAFPESMERVCLTDLPRRCIALSDDGNFKQSANKIFNFIAKPCKFTYSNDNDLIFDDFINEKIATLRNAAIKFIVDNRDKPDLNKVIYAEVVTYLLMLMYMMEYNCDNTKINEIEANLAKFNNAHAKPEDNVALCKYYKEFIIGNSAYASAVNGKDVVNALMSQAITSTKFNAFANKIKADGLRPTATTTIKQYDYNKALAPIPPQNFITNEDDYLTNDYEKTRISNIAVFSAMCDETATGLPDGSAVIKRNKFNALMGPIVPLFDNFSTDTIFSRAVQAAANGECNAALLPAGTNKETFVNLFNTFCGFITGKAVDIAKVVGVYDGDFDVGKIGGKGKNVCCRNTVLSSIIKFILITLLIILVIVLIIQIVKLVRTLKCRYECGYRNYAFNEITKQIKAKVAAKKQQKQQKQQAKQQANGQILQDETLDAEQSGAELLVNPVNTITNFAI